MRFKMHYRIYKACEKGDLDTIKNFIDKNDFSPYISTYLKPINALYIASEFGHLNIVKYLIDLGADFHSVDEYALYRAACNGHLHIVEYLVDIGADFCADNDRALYVAWLQGHINVAQYLLLKGSYNKHVFVNFGMINNIYSLGRFDLVHKLIKNKKCYITQDNADSFNNITKSICKIIKARKWNMRLFRAIYISDIIFRFD